MNCPLPRKVIGQILNANAFTIEEVRGGISKQVYKIHTDADPYMLYIWRRPYEGALTENKTEGANYLFADGFPYFVFNTKLLADLDIRVPQILQCGHEDDGDFDYAVVECFQGKSFQEYMDDGGDVAQYADALSALMGKLANKKRGYFGPPMEKKSFDRNISAEQLAFRHYKEELRIASALDSQVADMQERIAGLLKDKLFAVKPTETPIYSLIHGELTPPHIFVMEDDSLALIDIEAVKYFDMEYDWAVIELMYNGTFSLPEMLDADRLAFYKLCLQVGYLSVAVDYVKNVDDKNEFFERLKDNKLSFFMDKLTN
ncbi:MAG: phosphotransferase [Oscillospiraceae bacterium]|nr:phosphotransferase [Oscillospiraceae bacterium]